MIPAVALGGYIGLENRSEAAQVDFRDIQVQPGVALGTLEHGHHRLGR